MRAALAVLALLAGCAPHQSPDARRYFAITCAFSKCDIYHQIIGDSPEAFELMPGDPKPDHKPKPKK